MARMGRGIQQCYQKHQITRDIPSLLISLVHRLWPNTEFYNFLVLKSPKLRSFQTHFSGELP